MSISDWPAVERPERTLEQHQREIREWLDQRDAAAALLVTERESTLRAIGARELEWGRVSAQAGVRSVYIQADGGPPWLREWQAFSDMEQTPSMGAYY